MNPFLIILALVALVAFLGWFVGYTIAPTYKVTYAPTDSRNPHLPIQRYRIVSHPRKLAWKSHAGNRLFTALSAANHQNFIAFRADRVLSVNFAGFTLLSPQAQAKVKSTLTSIAPPVTAPVAA